MMCQTSRELLSAAADDEIGTDERQRLDAHLASCEDCTRYAARLDRLDRLVRIRPAEPVPDLVDAVTDRARPARLGRGGWIRPALVWVAIVIVAQNLRPLVFGDAGTAEAHMARHLGAFGVALAIGFVYAAWRPHRAFGLLPFTAALVVTMLASATFDLIDGGSSAFSEATHIAELVGLALLWMLAGSPGWHGLPRRRPRHHAPTS